MRHGNVLSETAQGLLVLKERIATAKNPPSQLDEIIQVAAWNIREFGKVHRTEAAIHFNAEILGRARRGIVRRRIKSVSRSLHAANLRRGIVVRFA